MTLGQKLAGYRKLSGLTQQQLGERLNISAQAISKWEKDLSEPALTTLRALAELYKVTVDELLDPNSGFPDMSVSAEEELSQAEPVGEQAEAEIQNDPSPTIGYCKHCGIAVNAENVGATQPAVYCKRCMELRLRQQQQTEMQLQQLRVHKENQARKADAAKRKRQANGRTLAQKRNTSFWIAGLFTAFFLAFMIIVMAGGFSLGLLAFTVIGSYVIFSFVACLFYDCFVQDVVIDWFSKSIQWPGLIFTFDVDGCLWLIGMKLLFWFLGLLFGIVTGAIGITLGLISAPFVFPYMMRKIHKNIQQGIETEL